MTKKKKNIIDINTIMTSSEIDELIKKYKLPNESFYLKIDAVKLDKALLKTNSQLVERLFLTVIFHLQEYNTYRWQNVLDFDKIASHYVLPATKVNSIFYHIRKTVPALKKAMSEYKNGQFKRWENYVKWLSEAELKRVNIREILYFFSNKTKQYQSLEKEVRAKGKSMLDVFSKVSVTSQEKVFGIANLPQ